MMMPDDLNELRQRAESGSCVGQCVLGLHYLYGIDVDVNYAEAFRLLSAAAEQNVSRAVLNLGYMHLRGLGVPKNLGEAIRHFVAVGTSSDSSDAFLARIELGRIYSGQQEDDAAFKWYSAAIAVASDEDCDELSEARAYVARTGDQDRPWNVANR